MSNRNTIGQKISLLLFQRGMRAMDLAREIDVPQPTIHRIIAGKSKNPHKETLQKISTFFNIDFTNLIDETIGHTKILSDDNTSSININSHSIPIIQLQENIPLDTLINDAKKNLIVTSEISDKAFGIYLADESLLPIFDIGTLLIFDPLKSVNIRSYVLVFLGTTHKYVIRRLLSDGENKFLKPLNPDIAKFGVKVLEDTDIIIATLVEARQSYL